jgi:septal ring factor EnvC (AmiA/AmiB activator)
VTIDGLTQIVVLLGTAAGAVGGTSAFVMGWLNRRQTQRNLAAQGAIAEAGAAEVVTGAALELLEPLRAELREARQEIASARTEAREARRETEAVRQELSDVNIKARALMRALTQAQDENTQLREDNVRLSDELARRRGRGA